MKADKKVLKKYIINVSVLTSTIVLIVASLYNEYMDKILRDLLAPFVSADLNNDGEPDLKQLREMIVHIGSIKFPIGNFFYNLFMLTIKIIILYFLVKWLLTKVKMSN